MADSPTDSHYDELDRLAARSLAAREGGAQADARSRGRGSVWPWAVVGLLFAFVLGMVGSPLFERSVRQNLPQPLQAQEAAPLDPRVEGLAERVSRLEAELGRPAAALAAPTDVTALGLRLQAVESQAIAAQTNDANLTARLDALAAEVARTSAALGQTDARTRDLFLLSVVRRMVEAGRPLTPIEDVIAMRFRDRDGAAVEALTAWSATPQTRRTLQSRLDTIAEAPGAGPETGWWDRLKARLSGLVTVRGERSEPADSEALLAQARAAMAAGDIGLAVSALGQERSPAVAQWVQDARILLAAEDAVGRLETDALAAGIGALQAPPPAVAG